MNDLEMIQSLRDGTPQITPEAASAARARLHAEWTSPPRSLRRWTMSRPVIRVALAGALGVTIAAAVTLSRLPGGEHDLSVASAAELGDRAAVAVERAPDRGPGPTQWIYTRSRNAEYKGDMNSWWKGMDTSRLNTVEGWERVDGRESAEFVDGKLKVTKSGWRYDWRGKPVGYKSPDQAGYRLTKMLPTEPRALLRTLYDPKTMQMAYQDLEGAGAGGPGPVMPVPPAGGSGGSQAASSVFDTIAELLRRPLPSALRAALYRALPQIRGVSVERDVRDAAGRRGIAFTHTFEGWNRQMIILDPVTYRFLGTYSYATEKHSPGGGEGTVNKGTVLKWTAQTALRMVGGPGLR
ncbi:CU044_5270 family protein [Actinomadura litoris]|uniref:CU044_5270 family protein n=1 Tax=Actinomadura litoris TaxID=2678616 RepID=UPI001FA6EDD9|nr:CU044_5270 family protein [Actinomadura litoris]